jgi:hypothetical protein
MTSPTNNEALNPLARLAGERRNMLKVLARSANLSHQWAAASAGAAVAHVVAAGHALAQARDLCEEGGWTRWLRKNFDGSVRTAQRYMRVARHLPAARLQATSLSLRSQAAAMRAIRGAVFTSPPAEGTPAVGGSTAATALPPAAADDEATARRLALVAARRLRKVARSLAASQAACAVDMASRIHTLATDFLLDAGLGPSTRGDVYFVEAVGAERIKIGVSCDVPGRFSQLAASFPGKLVLLGAVPGGRAREMSFHQRLAGFRIGGEWFHLTPGVRALILATINDQPE